MSTTVAADTRQTIIILDTTIGQYYIGLYRIALLQIRPEPHLVGCRNSNPAGSGATFGENLFWEHRTICLMKLMVSTMLTAAIKYSRTN